MKLQKSWGNAGEVILTFSAGDPADLNTEEPVFIVFDGLPVPFFIERLQQKGNRTIVKFEDIDTLEAADDLVGREIFVSSGQEESEDESIIGMTIIDQNGQEIGTVTDFNDYAGNTCITVIHSGKEIILPFHEDLVIKVRKERIYLNIPNGLLV